MQLRLVYKCLIMVFNEKYVCFNLYIFQNDEICAESESAVMTIDKRTVPAVSGLEYINIYGMTFKVKGLLACSSGWLAEFVYLPLLAEKYRFDRFMESTKAGLVQPHSSCCTIL